MGSHDPTPVYIMGIDENGQNVYTDQEDPTKRCAIALSPKRTSYNLNFSYIFDEDGNISSYENSRVTAPATIKMENSLRSDESSNDEMLADHCGIVSLGDPSHLGTANIKFNYNKYRTNINTAFPGVAMSSSILFTCSYYRFFRDDQFVRRSRWL